MSLAPAIVAALFALPVCVADLDDERKHVQLETVAVSISEAAEVTRWSRGPVDFSAMLVAIGYHESRYCLDVHAGAHPGSGRGLWQLEGQHRRYAGPFVGVELDGTINAARVAGDVLAHSWQCGGSAADLFTGYGGRACETVWPTLTERVATYEWARWVIEREAEPDDLPEWWRHRGERA